MDGEKLKQIGELVGDVPQVHLFQGDCNKILLTEVFPHVRYEQFRRGLCLLDPYGLHLDWSVLQTAGRMRTLDIFLNFPIMDMNRNALWRNPERVNAESVERMTAFWGDESWRDIAYSTTGNLFGEPEKESNDVIADAFRTRLREVGGFKYVPEPITMRNSTGATVYYLFFASHNEAGDKVARYILNKNRKKGSR